MTAAPTRRALIGAVIVAPAVAVVATCAGETPAKGVSSASTDLTAAILAHKRAEAISDRYDTAIYWPTKGRFDAAAAAIPHHTTTNGFDAMSGKRLTFCTSDEVHVRIARRVVADMDAGNLRSAKGGDYDLTMRELVRLADEREAAVAVERIATGIDRACERSDALCDRVADAAYAVAELPVHTSADLATKIAFVDAQGIWEAAREHVVADALTIGGMA